VTSTARGPPPQSDQYVDTTSLAGSSTPPTSARTTGTNLTGSDIVIDGGLITTI
jgi:hypothetical protein